MSISLKDPKGEDRVKPLVFSIKRKNRCVKWRKDEVKLVLWEYITMVSNPQYA